MKLVPPPLVDFELVCLCPVLTLNLSPPPQQLLVTEVTTGMVSVGLVPPRLTSSRLPLDMSPGGESADLAQTEAEDSDETLPDWEMDLGVPSTSSLPAALPF